MAIQAGFPQGNSLFNSSSQSAPNVPLGAKPGNFDVSTQAISMQGHVAEHAAMGLVFTPPTFDSAGVDIAYAQAVSMGGGTIFMPAGIWNLTKSLPISSRISYQGIPPSFTQVGNFPEDAGVISGGTQINLPAGVYGITYNSVDRGSPLNQTGGPNGFASDGLYGCRIYGLFFNGGLGPYKIGAVNASGAYKCIIDEIFYQNATAPWACDLHNSQYCNIGSITGINRLSTESGGIRFAQSVTNSVVLTGDLQFFGRIFITFGWLIGGGVRFESIGNGQLNDIIGVGSTWQVNGYTGSPLTLSTATTTSGGPLIAVTGADITNNWQYVQIGKPVYFPGGVPNWLEAGSLYWIVAKDDVAHTFQVSLVPSDTVGVTISATGSYPVRIGAFPAFEVRGVSGLGLITKFVSGAMNCESTAAIVPVAVYRGQSVELDIRTQGFSVADFAEIWAQDASGTVYVQNASINGSPVRMVGTQASFNLRPENNPPVTVTANTTLTLLNDKSTVYVNSATAVTITIPAMLPQGFSTIIVQQGAGQVTIAKGYSAMTLLSRSSYVKTLAGGAVKIDRVDTKTGTHYTNDDATYLLSGDLSA